VKLPRRQDDAKADPAPTGSRGTGGVSRRAMLQASAGAVAGTAISAAAGPLPALAGGGSHGSDHSHGWGDPDLIRIPPPRINAYTGGSPMSPRVLRALDTQTVPVNDAAFKDLFARTEALAAEVLETDDDVLLTPAEAIMCIEGAMRSAIRPGITALNLISGLYGQDYTGWMESFGATVIELRVPYNESIDPSSVEAILAQHPEVEFMSVVHVDTPSGTYNAIDQICPIAKAHGVVSMVDSASTYGSMPLHSDKWGADITVGASQKSVASPAAVGIISVSDAAWELFAKNPNAPVHSFLSLLDYKTAWFEQGRVPSTVSPTVTYGLYTALYELVRHVGVEKRLRETSRSARAFRAGARAMGIELWAASESIAADSNSTLLVPAGHTLQEAVDLLRQRYSVACNGTTFTGDPAGATIRVGHMGAAQIEAGFILRLLEAIGRAWEDLGADLDVRGGLRVARRMLSGW
jgi:pyridoxamine---pyruvate transaminase